MNVKTRGAMAALAAMVLFAPSALAQTAGKGSVGGSIGVPFFLADEDTKNGQSPRLLGQFQFQYAMNNRNRVAFGAGYGWVGYKAGTVAPYRMFHPGLNDSVAVMDDALTKVVPVSATFFHSFADQGKGWAPYAGLGVNVTRLEIVNDRQKIKDPATFDSYVNWAPGIHAQGGTELFVGSKKNVAFDWNVRFAKLFSKDEEQFPSGFTGPHTYMAINFGVNVYFWPVGHKPIETVPQPAPEGAPSAPEAAPVAPAPATPDTTLTPPPSPPPPPTPPDTARVDTTRAPGGSQQSPVSTILRREGAPPKIAPVAPAAGSAAVSATATKVAPRVLTVDDEGEEAMCPAPSVDPASSGMFGVPGVPVAPPRPPADDQPTPERSPEGSATP